MTSLGTLERAVVGREDARNKLAITRAALQFVVDEAGNPKATPSVLRDVCRSALADTEADA